MWIGIFGGDVGVYRYIKDYDDVEICEYRILV